MLYITSHVSLLGFSLLQLRLRVFLLMSEQHLLFLFNLNQIIPQSVLGLANLNTSTRQGTRQSTCRAFSPAVLSTPVGAVTALSFIQRSRGARPVPVGAPSRNNPPHLCLIDHLIVQILETGNVAQHGRLVQVILTDRVALQVQQPQLLQVPQ